MLISTFFSFVAQASVQTYVGSTPAHNVMRAFLQISLTDSIDFIRWRIEIDAGIYKVQCRYGLAKPGTPGFSNEQSISFKGGFSKSGNVYILKNKRKSVSILEVNTNVLHFLDGNSQMPIGNGGYSCALNNVNPVKADQFNILATSTVTQSPLVFEGRTPCRDLPALLGLNKSDACNKMKWYFLFYTDTLSGKPSYFLMGGMGYRKETMARGTWQIVNKSDGRIIYQLYSDKWVRALKLLKADDNILFFIDADGRLLVGDEHFSYTLNRRKQEYLPSR